MISDKRQWEVNVYNDLGFLFNGTHIAEDSCGIFEKPYIWTLATTQEQEMWNVFESRTPEFPVIEKDCTIECLIKSISGIEKEAIDGKFIWFRSFQTHDVYFHSVYLYLLIKNDNIWEWRLVTSEFTNHA